MYELRIYNGRIRIYFVLLICHCTFR